MVFSRSLDKILFFVHGAHGQRGFFRENTEKFRPIREICVRRILTHDLEKTLRGYLRDVLGNANYQYNDSNLLSILTP